jgi:hypothetical protein
MRIGWAEDGDWVGRRRGLGGPKTGIGWVEDGDWVGRRRRLGVSKKATGCSPPPPAYSARRRPCLVRLASCRTSIPAPRSAPALVLDSRRKPSVFASLRTSILDPRSSPAFRRPSISLEENKERQQNEILFGLVMIEQKESCSRSCPRRRSLKTNIVKAKNFLHSKI